MKSALAVLVAVVVVFQWGKALGIKSKPAPEPQPEQAIVDIYYLKNDGVYRVSSSGDSEAVVAPAVNPDQLKRLDDQLIYVDDLGQHQFSFASGQTKLIEERVLADDYFYVLKQMDDDPLALTNSELFAIDLSGDIQKRLTHDSSSVISKENLQISNRGRFLSWTSRDSSREGVASAWVYDLQLATSYQVNDQGFSPLVIER